MATYDTCEETSDKETEMSQLEEWLLMLVAGLGVYSIVVTVAWWRDSQAVNHQVRKLLTKVKKR